MEKIPPEILAWLEDRFTDLDLREITAMELTIKRDCVMGQWQFVGMIKRANG